MTEPRLKPGPVAEPVVFLDEDDDSEPTKEEIMEDIRQGLRYALAGGEGTPALEGIAEIERRIYGDDDREPTKAEIMDDIRQGLRDARAGYAGQDAMEFLEELEREVLFNADES